ncbi:hypothetical protein AB0M02_10600 [Actinoplanes sp. NPDC051861]|uniref:hypothetical protein n=1 Tax=Actinoplanes sp. NPDC051861 TaxID=3155170 RepID=UPI003427DA10
MQTQIPIDPATEGRRQVLLQIWKETREHSRQHESQRATATNMILLLAAADIGAMATLRFGPRTLPLAAGLVVLGVLGYLLAAKHYERAQLSTAIAVELEMRLDAMDPALKIRDSKIAASGRHESRYRRMHRVRLNKIWSLLHVLLGITGAVTFVAILISSP